MKIKKLLAMIEILAVTSLVSVGFSSWTIVYNPDPQYEDINIVAEDIINVSDYVSNISMSFSEFAKEGFVSDNTFNSSSSNIGYLNIQYTFDLESFINEQNFTGNSLSFETQLGYSSSTYPFNIIEYYDDNNSSIKYTIDSNSSVTASKTVLESDDLVTFAYTITSESLSTQKTIKNNLIVAFDVTNYIGNSTFEETVYTKLSTNASIPFNIVIAVNNGD